MTDEQDNGVDIEEAPTSFISFISVEYADDHSIEGVRIQIQNVTPLQIVTAIYYLQRAANRLADAQEYMQAQAAEHERNSTLEVVRDIQAERRAAKAREN